MVLLLGFNYNSFEQPILFQQKLVDKKVFIKDGISFLGNEIKYSLDELKSPENNPEIIFGEPIGGDFASAAFAQALQRYIALSGKNVLGTHQLENWIKYYFLKEMKDGGTTFSQLFAASVLYQSCLKKNNLSTSPLWNGLSGEQQIEVIKFLDVTRFWNEAKDDMGGRPNNYYAVALYTEAYCNALKISTDKNRYSRLMKKCLEVLERNNGVLDDSKKFNGAFDRYLHEFNRFIWEASELVNDEPSQLKMEIWMKRSELLWWQLYSPSTGHASLWGRSRQNSWDDTFEQVGFLANHPNLSPITLPKLGATYINCWNIYFTHEYNTERHLNRMLDEGRATWSYAKRNRIWSYSVGTLSKICYSFEQLKKELEANTLQTIDNTVHLKKISIIQFFNSKNGVWIFQNSNRNLVLPFVGYGATSDYLPAPYGLDDIEMPVQVNLPMMVPFLTLENGETVTVCQGADLAKLIKKNELLLQWNDVQTIEGLPSSKGLKVSCKWKIRNNSVVMLLVFSPQQLISIQKFDFRVPLKEAFTGILNCNASWQIRRIQSAADSVTYHGGAFKKIGSIVSFEANQLQWEAGKKYTFKLTVKK
jgi:hypothetical protein